MTTAVLPSFVTGKGAEGHWRRPFLRRNGPKTGGEGGRPHAPRRRDRMESKIASGVHAARQCGWRGSAGAAYLVWMPQLDGKGSPRGAVTGVERGGEVERVVIVHRTAVLACVRARGAACALQLGVPAAGVAGGSSSRAAGPAAHVDWDCWYHKPSCAFDTPPVLHRSHTCCQHFAHNPHLTIAETDREARAGARW